MRRFVVLVVFLTLLAPAPAEAAAPARSWAQAEIKLVVSQGLMAESVATFRPNAPLTQRALSELIAGLTDDEAQAPAPTSQSSAQVTIAQLDAQLVRALGVGEEASSFYRAAAAAGTRPPARFGTEVVARLLGLRKNHEAPHDHLERLPSDPATRAEAAYSAAKILRFSGWELRQVEEAALTFELPALTPWQRRILTTAFGRIGFPYVWGGESDFRVSPFGLQASGGFD
ncbi:MAG: hypothetical protein ACRDKU_08270, partial [Gaiellaceae bacterium]